MQTSSRIHFRTTPFLLYVNNMPQAAECKLLLYSDDNCLIFQHKHIIKTETALNKNFSMLSDCL